MRYLFLYTKYFVCRLIIVGYLITSFQIPMVYGNTTSGLTGLKLPVPGRMVEPTVAFDPVRMLGIRVNPSNPLEFDFLIDSGDAELAETAFSAESERLIKYFLAALTTPEKDIWVNLSPAEGDRIVAESFGQTEMGRDLLAQDYLLKQLTASLIYPERDLGAEFWRRVRQQAEELYGITEVPVETFNKVWIVPDRAAVFEDEGTAYIVDSHLKVMLESDYLAAQQLSSHKQNSLDTVDTAPYRDLNQVSTQLVRELILPEIEREINSGENFAPLRQIYHSLILAAWYKRSLAHGFLGQVYVDQNRTSGIQSDDPNVKQKIYEQYLSALRLGVYDYIREDVNPVDQSRQPRRYVSGGFAVSDPTDGMGLDDRLDVYDARNLRSASRTIQGRIDQLTANADNAQLSDRLKIVTARLAETVAEAKIWASMRESQWMARLILGNRYLNFMYQAVRFRNPAGGKNLPNFRIPRDQIIARIFESPKDTRRIIAMHTKPVVSQGPYISHSIMDPGHIQPFHRHHVTPEFNLLLHPTTLVYELKGEEYRVEGQAGDMFFVPADFMHTLENHTDDVVRNLTVKPFFDPRILNYSLDQVNTRQQADSVRIIKPREIQVNGSTIKEYEITTRGYQDKDSDELSEFRYRVELIYLKPGASLTLESDPQQVADVNGVITLVSPGLIEIDDEIGAEGLVQDDVYYTSVGQTVRLINKVDETVVVYRAIGLDPTADPDRPTARWFQNYLDRLGLNWTTRVDQMELEFYEDIMFNPQDIYSQAVEQALAYAAEGSPYKVAAPVFVLNPEPKDLDISSPDDTNLYDITRMLPVFDIDVARQYLNRHEVHRDIRLAFDSLRSQLVENTESRSGSQYLNPAEFRLFVTMLLSAARDAGVFEEFIFQQEFAAQSVPGVSSLNGAQYRKMVSRVLMLVGQMMSMSLSQSRGLVSARLIQADLKFMQREGIISERLARDKLDQAMLGGVLARYGLGVLSALVLTADAELPFDIPEIAVDSPQAVQVVDDFIVERSVALTPDQLQGLLREIGRLAQTDESAAELSSRLQSAGQRWPEGIDPAAADRLIQQSRDVIGPFDMDLLFQQLVVIEAEERLTEMLAGDFIIEDESDRAEFLSKVARALVELGTDTSTDTVIDYLEQRALPQQDFEIYAQLVQFMPRDAQQMQRMLSALEVHLRDVLLLNQEPRGLYKLGYALVKDLGVLVEQPWPSLVDAREQINDGTLITELIQKARNQIDAGALAPNDAAMSAEDAELDEVLELLELLGIDVDRLVELPPVISLPVTQATSNIRQIRLEGRGGIGTPGERAQYFTYDVKVDDQSLGGITFLVYDRIIAVQNVRIDPAGQGIGGAVFNWLALVARASDRQLGVYTRSIAALRGFQSVLTNVTLDGRPIEVADVRQDRIVQQRMSTGEEVQITGDPSPKPVDWNDTELQLSPLGELIVEMYQEARTGQSSFNDAALVMRSALRKLKQGVSERNRLTAEENRLLKFIQRRIEFAAHGIEASPSTTPQIVLSMAFHQTLLDLNVRRPRLIAMLEDAFTLPRRANSASANVDRAMWATLATIAEVEFMFEQLDDSQRAEFARAVRQSQQILSNPQRTFSSAFIPLNTFFAGVELDPSHELAFVELLNTVLLESGVSGVVVNNLRAMQVALTTDTDEMAQYRRRSAFRKYVDMLADIVEDYGRYHAGADGSDVAMLAQAGLLSEKESIERTQADVRRYTEALADVSERERIYAEITAGMNEDLLNGLQRAAQRMIDKPSRFNARQDPLTGLLVVMARTVSEIERYPGEEYYANIQASITRLVQRYNRHYSRRHAGPLTVEQVLYAVMTPRVDAENPYNHQVLNVIWKLPSDLQNKLHTTYMRNLGAHMQNIGHSAIERQFDLYLALQLIKKSFGKIRQADGTDADTVSELRSATADLLYGVSFWAHQPRMGTLELSVPAVAHTIKGQAVMFGIDEILSWTTEAEVNDRLSAWFEADLAMKSQQYLFENVRSRYAVMETGRRNELIRVFRQARQQLKRSNRDALAALIPISTYFVNQTEMDSDVERMVMMPLSLNLLLNGFRVYDGLSLYELHTQLKASELTDAQRAELTEILEDFIDESLYMLAGVTTMLGDAKPLLKRRGDDAAMLTESAEPVGGIDFRMEQLNLKIHRDAAGIPVPNQSYDDIQIEGFIPVILNIAPAPSLPIFMGLPLTQGESTPDGYDQMVDYANPNGTTSSAKGAVRNAEQMPL